MFPGGVGTADASEVAPASKVRRGDGSAPVGVPFVGGTLNGVLFAPMAALGHPPGELALAAPRGSAVGDSIADVGT